MHSFVPSEIPVPRLHQYLLGAIAPRPIAFVSTQSKEGNINLSPFSFFNVFGSNPPVLIFSPARSGRTGTTKHTLDYVQETGECVVNIINHSLLHQASLASGEYPKGVNEFVKGGFTAIASDIVAPPRVAECPVQMECRVLQIVMTGLKGGAGNLVICEILKIHIHENVLDAEDMIDPYKMDYVARMGKNWWCRILPESIIDIPAAGIAGNLGIGYDALPESIRKSDWLSGNEIAQLASVTSIPGREEQDAYMLSREPLAGETLQEEVRKLIRDRRYREALILLCA